MNIEQRQFWMSVLARAPSHALENAWTNLDPKPEVSHVRAPEIGMVMVRAKSGGTGEAFNMGEATLARCTVRVDNKKTGFGYVKGRSKRHAELAAVFDALLQDEDHHDMLMSQLIRPQHSTWTESRSQMAADVAKTKVDFFTLVRGE